MQIRHRSAYYDAFFTEALLAYADTGLASLDQAAASRRAIAEMVEFCLVTSREEVRVQDGGTISVITALAPLPHPRFSRFFAQIKQDLGFGVYVPDCDTTACAFSAATQAGSDDPILEQPLLDFYAGYQVEAGANEPKVTVPLNDKHRLRRRRRLPGSTILPANGRSATISIPPSILDILKVSFRNAQPLEDHQDPARPRHPAADHRLSQPRLVLSGAVLQSAFRTSIICQSCIARLFRPLLCGVHGDAAAGAAGDRPRRHVRADPRPGAGLCPDPELTDGRDPSCSTPHWR